VPLDRLTIRENEALQQYLFNHVLRFTSTSEP